MGSPRKGPAADQAPPGGLPGSAATEGGVPTQSSYAAHLPLKKRKISLPASGVPAAAAAGAAGAAAAVAGAAGGTTSTGSTSASQPPIKKLKLHIAAKRTEGPTSAQPRSGATPSKTTTTKSPATSSATTTPRGGARSSSTSPTTDEWILPKPELKLVLDELFAAVYDLVDPKSGRWIGEAFAQLPDRAVMPEYYEAVTQPMSLDAIANKINRYKYQGVEAMRQEMELVFGNAMFYNQPSSQLYKDAIFLRRRWQEAYARLRKRHGPPPPAEPATAGATAADTPAPSSQRPTSAPPTGKITLTLSTKKRAATPAQGTSAVAAGAPSTPASAPSKKAPTGPRKTIDLLLDTLQNHGTEEEGKRLLVRRLCKAIQSEAIASTAKPEDTDRAALAAVNELRPAQLGDAHYSWAPIHSASFFGRSEAVRILVEAGADVELEDGWYGGRPLAWAAYGGHLDTCATLRDLGASPTATNSLGQRAFDLLPEDEQADREWRAVLLPPPPEPVRPAHAKPIVGRGTDKLQELASLATGPSAGSLDGTYSSKRRPNTFVGGLGDDNEDEDDDGEEDLDDMDDEGPDDDEEMVDVRATPSATGRSLKGAAAHVSANPQAKLVQSLGLVSNNGLMRFTLDTVLREDGFLLTVPRYIGAFTFRLHLLPLPKSLYSTSGVQRTVRPAWAPVANVSATQLLADATMKLDLVVTPVLVASPQARAVRDGPQQQQPEEATAPGEEKPHNPHHHPYMQDVSVRLAEGVNAFEFCVTRQALDGSEPRWMEDRFSLLIHRS